MGDEKTPQPCGKPDPWNSGVGCTLAVGHEGPYCTDGGKHHWRPATPSQQDRIEEKLDAVLALLDVSAAVQRLDLGEGDRLAVFLRRPIRPEDRERLRDHVIDWHGCATCGAPLQVEDEPHVLRALAPAPLPCASCDARRGLLRLRMPLPSGGQVEFVAHQARIYDDDGPRVLWLWAREGSPARGSASAAAAAARVYDFSVENLARVVQSEAFKEMARLLRRRMMEGGPGIARLALPPARPTLDMSDWVSDEDLLPDA